MIDAKKPLIERFLFSIERYGDGLASMESGTRAMARGTTPHQGKPSSSAENRVGSECLAVLRLGRRAVPVSGIGDGI